MADYTNGYCIKALQQLVVQSSVSPGYWQWITRNIPSTEPDKITPKSPCKTTIFCRFWTAKS